MESYTSLTSHPHLMESIAQDHMIFDSINDPLILDYDRGFNEFMFSDDGWFIDNELGWHVDSMAGSPDHNGRIEGDVRASTGSEEGVEEKQGEENSSGMTKRVLRPRRDRSKTLVSERKRRGRMKEKLYELRSLVPNITKMDKASIISDAVVYVQNLQKQANKLVEEIARLESSFKDGSLQEVYAENLRRTAARPTADVKHHPIEGKILRVVAHEVADGRFYVRIECGRGDQVSSSLFGAIESLESFHVESSNFTIISEKSALTLTLKAADMAAEMDAQTMKLWVIGALLKEGFEFDTKAIL